MRHIQTFPLLIILALLVSSCGAPAAPTISAADVQTTAVAAAHTLVAQTQAAIPTNTAIPPTEAPTQAAVPTDTPVLFNTLAADTLVSSLPTLQPTATVQSGSGADPCNAALAANPDGRPTKIKIVNRTNGPIVASLYLNLTPFGVCGFRGYNLSKGGAVTITDLVYGCYNVSVFVNDPKNPSKAFGYGCINNPDLWIFEVHPESVKFLGG